MNHDLISSTNRSLYQWCVCVCLHGGGSGEVPTGHITIRFREVLLAVGSQDRKFASTENLLLVRGRIRTGKRYRIRLRIRISLKYG